MVSLSPLHSPALSYISSRGQHGRAHLKHCHFISLSCLLFKKKYIINCKIMIKYPVTVYEQDSLLTQADGAVGANDRQPVRLNKNLCQVS